MPNHGYYQQHREACVTYARDYYQEHKEEAHFVAARLRTASRLNKALADLKEGAAQGDPAAQQQLAAHREYDKLRKRQQRAAKQK